MGIQSEETRRRLREIVRELVGTGPVLDPTASSAAPRR
jgi:hypothetical protein